MNSIVLLLTRFKPWPGRVGQAVQPLLLRLKTN